jgi:hypothetical protein
MNVRYRIDIIHRSTVIATIETRPSRREAWRDARSYVRWLTGPRGPERFRSTSPFQWHRTANRDGLSRGDIRATQHTAQPRPPGMPAGIWC